MTTIYYDNEILLRFEILGAVTYYHELQETDPSGNLLRYVRCYLNYLQDLNDDVAFPLFILDKDALKHP